MQLDARIDVINTCYQSVDANSNVLCPGFLVPDGEQYAVYRFRANGADPSAYVALVWDWQGLGQKVISSTRGDIDLFFDPSIDTEHLIGDGVKKLNILITNNHDTATPIVGGSFELIKVD